MKRWMALLLGFLMALPVVARGVDDAYLSANDLGAVKPAYEAFLDALADVLIEKGLLDETEREPWLLYQIGDYLQNGGFGMIAVLYTPGLLAIADEAVTARRMSVETQAGTLHLETLRRYTELYSPLPGLPLDAELVGAEGQAVACRFRWSASDGSLLIWDGAQDAVVNVGATFINDDRPLYWYEEPMEGVDVTLTLELLSPSEDERLALVELVVLSGPDFWSPEVLR